MHNSFSVRKRVTALTLLSASFIPLTMAFAAPPQNGAASVDNGLMAGIRVNEIFQRDAQNRANITLKVANKSRASAYSYYSISLQNVYGTRQAVLAEGYYSGQDFLSFSLPPQANFSQIRVSFYNGPTGTEMLAWNSPMFNVGEVFLIAGQSNAGNHGTIGSTPSTAAAIHRSVELSNVDSFNRTATATWAGLNAQTNNPFVDSGGNGNVGSPWAIFANALGTQLQAQENLPYPVPVAVLNVAVGGSALEFWQKNAPSIYPSEHQHFYRLETGGKILQRLNANGGNTCSFRAVLWHQGEANAERDFDKSKNQLPNTSIYLDPADRKTYARLLTQVARDFRTDTQCPQPWVVASATWESTFYWSQNKRVVNDKRRAETEIRKAQRYLWSRTSANPYSAANPEGDPIFKPGPDTDMISGEGSYLEAPRKYRRDGVHMSATGLDLHGRMWAARVAKVINSSAPPATEEMVWEVGSVLADFTQVLGRKPEEMELDNEGLRFWVQTKIDNPGVDVASALAASDEKYVRDTFQNLLGRRPAWWEANYWVKQLSTNATTRSALSGPDQVGYENTLSPNGKKVFRLYVNTMGRTLPEILRDAGGMAHWTSALDNNQLSESDIDNYFKSSAEYRVRKAFEKAFGRQPSQTELNKYTSTIGSYSSDPALAQAVWNNEVPIL